MHSFCINFRSNNQWNRMKNLHVHWARTIYGNHSMVTIVGMFQYLNTSRLLKFKMEIDCDWKLWDAKRCISIWIHLNFLTHHVAHSWTFLVYENPMWSRLHIVSPRTSQLFVMPNFVIIKSNMYMSIRVRSIHVFIVYQRRLIRHTIFTRLSVSWSKLWFI